MAIVGALTYVSLVLIGVPFAIPLSVVVAFGELIPLIGSWLARIPLLAIPEVNMSIPLPRSRALWLLLALAFAIAGALSPDAIE